MVLIDRRVDYPTSLIIPIELGETILADSNGFKKTYKAGRSFVLSNPRR